MKIANLLEQIRIDIKNVYKPTVPKEKRSISEETYPWTLSLLISSTKHKSWQYENEYRIIAQKEFLKLLDPCFNKAKSSLKLLGIQTEAIFIGLNCSEIHKKRLESIGNILNIPIYQTFFDNKTEKFALSIKAL